MYSTSWPGAVIEENKAVLAYSCICGPESFAIVIQPASVEEEFQTLGRCPVAGHSHALGRHRQGLENLRSKLDGSEPHALAGLSFRHDDDDLVFKSQPGHSMSVETKKGTLNGMEMLEFGRRRGV